MTILARIAVVLAPVVLYAVIVHFIFHHPRGDH